MAISQVKEVAFPWNLVWNLRILVVRLCIDQLLNEESFVT